MDKNHEDPLNILFSEDIGAAERQKIAGFLKTLIALDRTNKQIGVLPDFEKLSSNFEKIEVVLMASKALSLALDGIVDGMTQKEVISLGIMPAGSVKNTLKKLFDSKKIGKNKNSKYFIPDYRITEVIKKHNLLKK